MMGKRFDLTCSVALIASRCSLSKASKKFLQSIGTTWLDTELMSGQTLSGQGFAKDVEAAKVQRRQFLINEKLIGKDGIVDIAALKKLEKMDLSALGKALSSKLCKAYSPAPSSGRLSGTYRQTIDRPSGKYAVIEKSKEFTLVPWRETMDLNLGKSISGGYQGSDYFLDAD